MGCACASTARRKRVSISLVTCAVFWRASGATVYRGLMGFGPAGHLHAPGHRPGSHDRPMVITAVDTEPAIRRAIVGIADLVTSGLVVCSAVEIIKYARVPSAPMAAMSRASQDETPLA
jgi:PII-like signaling protein